MLLAPQAPTDPVVKAVGDLSGGPSHIWGALDELTQSRCVEVAESRVEMEAIDQCVIPTNFLATQFRMCDSVDSLFTSDLDHDVAGFASADLGFRRAIGVTGGS